MEKITLYRCKYCNKTYPFKEICEECEKSHIYEKIFDEEQNAKLLVITEDHLKLVKRFYFDWNKCEFGSPEVNCKRPFGNSAVFDDMGEILGIEPEQFTGEDEVYEYSEKQKQNMYRLYCQLKDVLEICCRNLEFKCGRYKRQETYYDWQEF